MEKKTMLKDLDGSDIWITDACEKYNLKYDTLRHRYRTGKQGHELFAKVVPRVNKKLKKTIDNYALTQKMIGLIPVRESLAV